MIVYDTPNYATSRLSETYVRDPNNHLFYVTQARWSDVNARTIILEGRNLRGEPVRFPITDCDLSPLPLGHVNLVDITTSQYLSRMPVRNDWRQGTRIRQLFRGRGNDRRGLNMLRAEPAQPVRNRPMWDVEPPVQVREHRFDDDDELEEDHGGHPAPPPPRPNVDPFWMAVDDCVNNKYPPLYEAQERVQDIFDACAFSKRFRLDDRGRLIYKNRGVVGTCEVEPRLDNKFTWLSEVLEEDMRNVEL